MMSQKRDDIAMPVTGLAGVRAWLLDAWPTALPLCALLVASLAPLAVLTFSFAGSKTWAIASLVVALATILILSFISRLSLNRGQHAS
jgi:hypothetical protein